MRNGHANSYRPPALAILMFASFLMIAPRILQAKDAVDYVNPLIGAGSTSPTPDEASRLKGLDPNFTGFHGKLFPGPCTPAGLVQLSPDTITGGDNGAGYSYPNFTIQGFSFNHMSGVGAFGDLGNFMVMPTEGPLKTWYGETDHPGTGYLSSYSKETEVAQAGYYAVTLDDYKVRAEITAAPHSGILRFTFPQSEASRIQIDLARRVGGTSLHQTVKVVGDHTIEGEIECTGKGGGFMGGKVSYNLFYHAEFSKPLKDFGVWSANIPPGPYNGRKPAAAFVEACQSAEKIPGCREKEGRHLGFYAEFPTHDKDVILLKAGISYVSIAGAAANLAAEIPAWDFDAVRNEAHDLWQHALSRVSVEGGTEDQKTIFYTAMYHALIDPRSMADVDGKYPGADGKAHQAVGYTKRTIFSGWDVYRSQFPLLTIVAPSIVNDQINSAIGLAEENGTHYFDRWELLNCYTGCMCGSPEVTVINDAYQKGIRDFDLKKAYEYSLNTCEKNSNGPKGYYTGGHGLAITLENGFGCWNLSQLASASGHPDDAKKYADLSQAYHLVFNPDEPWTYEKKGTTDHPDWKGWVCFRNENGDWAPWQGLTSGEGGMESSIFETGWDVPHDSPGLIALLGGKALFVAKLNAFFEHTPKFNKGNPYMDPTNEPSNLIPFLFNRAGAPWLTQKWVRRVATEAYAAAPNGNPGDDDEGQISAWFVLAASGLHPACPGDPRFEIFTPLFDKVTLNLDPKYAKGSAFTIVAQNNSPQNVYIQSATLDGKPFNRCWLNYSEITAGGTLELVLGPQPNMNWGIEQGQ
jgi:predicted alpha-1,2-mannosidase